MVLVDLPPAFLTDVNDIEVVPRWNGRYALQRRVIYRTLAIGSHPEVVVVPAGFEMDWASIPRPLEAIWRPDGCWGPAAVVHDWLYHTKGRPNAHRLRPVRCTRAEADKVFLEAMKVLGVPRWQRWAFYLAVRIGGRAAWNDRPEGTPAAAARRAA